jgi:excisionase family DNA binding protein
MIGEHMELDWISPQQAADQWGLSARHVQALCKSGKIKGVALWGRSWLIPKDAERPIDGRTLAARMEKEE